PQRIAVGGNDDILARQDLRQDLADIVGQYPGQGVAQAFAAGRGDVVGAAPVVDLLLTPVLARLVLVETGKFAVIPLVQRDVAPYRKAGLAELFEDDVERALGARKFGGERQIERIASGLEPAACVVRFAHALFGQVRVLPA